MFFIIQVYVIDDNEWVDVAHEDHAAWAIRTAKRYEKTYERVRVVKRSIKPFIDDDPETNWI